MAESPSYVIVGQGRWAHTMCGILAAEGRRTISIGETRRKPSESESSYKSRLSLVMSASDAQIAWLCVPPGRHIPLMVEAAIGAGLHTVVEKPWLCSRSESESLLALAQARRLLVAIHYEYCLLEDVESWRNEFNGGIRLCFGGRFTVSRSDPPSVLTIDNLRSHLLAIRAYAVPKSGIAEIRCGYGLPDERNVWVGIQDRRIGFIDFLNNHEPIIQRFIGRLEAALEGTDFPFGLELASRVADDVDALKQEQAGPARMGIP
jgi:hypothetical protein